MDSSETPRASMPMIIYGTARKGKSSGDLVYEAIKSGFRGIDTGVGEHYDEASVGKGLQRVYDEGIVKRCDLYIQTKVSLTDPRFLEVPGTLTDKISWSISKSITTLNPTNPSGLLHHCAGFFDSDLIEAIKTKSRYLDCVLLHEPGTLSETIAAMRVLNQKIEEGEIRSFGICNISAEFTKNLLDKEPHLNPAIIQNPFSRHHADFDVETRSLATNRRIAYQAFYVLSANKDVWERANYVQKIANHAQVSNAVAWFSLLISANIAVLNGTSCHHMRENIEGVEKVEVWRSSDSVAHGLWVRCREVFLGAINGDYDEDSVE